MIYTRFGSPVKIVDVISESSVVIEFEDGERGNREIDIIELKADGGIQEIDEAMKELEAQEPDANDDYSQHEDELYQPSFFEPID